MKTSGAWLPWLFGTAIGVPLLFVALCWGLYAWSARDVPDIIPASTVRAPESVRKQFLAIGTGGATRMRRVNPVTFWVAHVGAAETRSGNAPADLQLLRMASRHAKHRHWRGDSMAAWHAASIAYTVDIGRQWTFDQAVDTLLAESHFGRDSIGIDAAARAYFGVRAAELRPQESLALIALMKGPSWYGPDCHRERFRERYAWAAEALGNSGPEWTPEAALSRMLPRDCVR